MSKGNAFKSKIPTALYRLTPISAKAEQRRQPLETLYQESANVEGAVVNRKDKKVRRRSKSDLTEFDTQYLTTGRTRERDILNLGFCIFNDSDDKDTLTDEGARGGVLNLKRPHSKELFGNSAVWRDEKRKHLADFPDCADPNSGSHYQLDLFNYLLKRETTATTPPRISDTERASIMNWLVKVNGRTGNPAVVQTAAWYFDNLLVMGEVQVDKLQVLATACYWIAMKLRLQGQVRSAKKMVSLGPKAYSVKLLLSAERNVLKKLKFPAQPIVPQDFISYWSWVCDASSFVEIEAAAAVFSMASQVIHKDFLKHYPSVSAAAAMNNALHSLRKKNLLIKLEKNQIYKAAVRKHQFFEDLCSLQRKAVHTMSHPRYKYRTLLTKSKDALTVKILTYINKSL